MEDNPADVGLVREALEEHGVSCELIVINNGERAARFIREFSDQTRCPDLIILDLNLPRKPGLEVLKQMRASLKCSHVPIVILTSSELQKDKDETTRLGASTYIRKPSNLDDFMMLGSVFKAMLNVSGRGRI